MLKEKQKDLYELKERIFDQIAEENIKIRKINILIWGGFAGLIIAAFYFFIFSPLTIFASSLALVIPFLFLFIAKLFINHKINQIIYTSEILEDVWQKKIKTDKAIHLIEKKIKDCGWKRNALYHLEELRDTGYDNE